MKRARGILSLVLALVMCLSLPPVTALAEEGEGEAPPSYTITFDANGGAFPDGSTTKTLQTKQVGGENLIDGFVPEPVREGYTFLSWGRSGPNENPSVFNFNFPSDATVTAYWEKAAPAPALEIALNPNGGVCAVKTLPLTFKDGGYILEGPLPTPTRDGFTFQGWYRGYESDQKPGWRIDVGETFTAPDPITAVWSKDGPAELEPVRIDFFANGGRITQMSGKAIPALDPAQGPYMVDGSTGVDQRSGIGWTATDTHGTLGSIPAAARDGYTFDGWYPLPAGTDFWSTVGSNYTSEVFTSLSGSRLTTSTVHTEEVTYAAKWTAAGKTFTVTFNLNGASGTAPAPQKVASGKTVDLPTIQATGAKFLGWGYSTDGKTLQPWPADRAVTADITLYARWQFNSSDTLRGLSYAFSNSNQAYGYSSSYRIPLERYKLVFGDNEFASALYKNMGAWQGSCFGMSATSSLFYVDNGVNASAFRSGAKVPGDLAVNDRNTAWGLTLKEYIEAMQISQCAASMSKGLRDVVSAVESFDKDGPVIIGITGAEGGHAVVGYAIQEDSAAQDRLLIYDPNYPNQERAITLTKSGSGYTGWSYQLDGSTTWSSRDPRGTIACLTYDEYEELQDNWSSAPSRDRNLLFVSFADGTIADRDGKTVATIAGSEVTSTRSDIYPMNDFGGSEQSGTAVWVPAGEAFTVTSANGGSVNATLVNVEQSVRVATTAKTVTFAVNDKQNLAYARIPQEGASFNITLSSTSSQGHREAQLMGTGTAAGGTAFAWVSGDLSAAGTDSKTTLRVDGKGAELSTLSTGLPDVNTLLSGKVTAPAGDNPFTDVVKDAYYYDAVLWAVKNGVTGGTTPTTFSPNNPCTRGQIVTFLWRAAGSPKPSGSDSPFADVQAGAYYYDAVLWAVEKGITGGTSATAFSPNTPCTRGQTVTFLYRAAGSPKPAGGTSPFTDVQGGAYYYDAVLWAVEKGITGGTSATTFSPANTVTRGQTVTFLFRSQGK